MQGLPPLPKATERVRPGSKPSPSRPLAVPPLPRGRGFGKGGRYRPHQLTGIKQKLHALAKGSPLREPSPSRPLAVPPLPRGRGFGKGGRYRPHQLTGIKQKLHALAKGSPLRGSCRRRRLRGFVPASNPLRHGLWPCHLSREGEALAKAEGIALTS